MLKTSAFIFLFTAILSSCARYTPPEPTVKYELELLSLASDTTFLLRNTDRKDKLAVTITGNISRIGALRFSADSAKVDSASGTAFGPGEVNVFFYLGGVNGRDQYVRYLPIRDSTDGKLTMKFSFE